MIRKILSTLLCKRTFAEFEALFEPLGPEYISPTRLVDKYVGFSVIREYPEGLRFKTAVTTDGMPDTVALIHVLIDPDLPKIGGRAPIRTRVSKFSKFLSKHFDYDFSDKASPTEESVRLSQASIQPSELMIVGEYFLESDGSSIRDKVGVKISGKSVLDDAFSKHVRTLGALSSAQLKVRIGKFESILLTFLCRSSKFVLTKILGRVLVPDKEMRFLFYGYAPEDVRKSSTESVRFFDYLVPKPVAILFCALVALSFLCFHFSEGSSSYLRAISTNGVLAATHGILALFVLNDVIPSALRHVLNFALIRGGRSTAFPITEFM